MKYMLDTDMCIYMIREKPESVIRRVRRTNVFNLCISAITLSELEYGVGKSSRPAQNQVALAGFLAPLRVVPYDDMAAREYGRLRTSLEKQGTPIGSLDMLIAAHALSLNCTLVTNNEAEFIRVPRLRVQNWAK
jgi:tRNA(fMet)-specific endonuclease VapC